jgi:hypothetical protein
VLCRAGILGVSRVNDATSNTLLFMHNSLKHLLVECFLSINNFVFNGERTLFDTMKRLEND